MSDWLALHALMRKREARGRAITEYWHSDASRIVGLFDEPERRRWHRIGVIRSILRKYDTIREVHIEWTRVWKERAEAAQARVAELEAEIAALKARLP